MKETLTFIISITVCIICFVYHHTIEQHEKFVDCVLTVDLNEYESDLDLDKCYHQLDKNLIGGIK